MVNPIIPVDDQLLLIMKVVQIIGGLVMLVSLVTAVWSLLLQKKEVVKQNQRIIDLLEKILEK